MSGGTWGGWSDIFIRDNYSNANIRGKSNIGGLIGKLKTNSGIAEVDRVYFTTQAKGDSNVDMGIGSTELVNPSNFEIKFKDSFFDKTKIPQSDKNGLKGKTTKEMQQKSTFTNAGWDFDNVWRIQEGSDYPRLRALTEAKIVINPTTPVNPTNIGIKANDLNKVYDGKEIKYQSDLEQLNGWNGTGVTVLDKDGKTVNIDLNDSNIFTGKLRFDGEGSNWQNARNAGKYTIVPTGLSGGQKYEIEYGNGTLTIDKKPIAINSSRVYDGTTDATHQMPFNVLTGVKEQLIDSDRKQLGILGDVSFTLTGKGTLPSKDVADNIKLIDKGTLQLGGTIKVASDIISNYDIDTSNSHWTINKKPLVIKAMNNVKAIGAENPTTGEVGVLASGLIDGETIRNVQIAFEKKDGKIGDIYNIIPSDVEMQSGKLSNYEVIYQNGKILVTPKYTKWHKEFAGNYYFSSDEKIVDEVKGYKDLLDKVQDEILLASAINGENVNITDGFEIVKNHNVLGTPKFTGAKDIDVTPQLYKKKGSEQYYLVLKDEMYDYSGYNEISVIASSYFARRHDQVQKWVTDIANKVNQIPLGKLTVVGNYASGSSAIYSAMMNDYVNAVTFNSNPLLHIDKNKISTSMGDIININFGYVDFKRPITPNVGDNYHVKMSTSREEGLRGWANNSDRNDYKMSQVLFDQKMVNLVNENNENSRSFNTVVQSNRINNHIFDLTDTQYFSKYQELIEKDRKFLIEEHKDRESGKLQGSYMRGKIYNFSRVYGNFSLVRDGKLYDLNKIKFDNQIVFLDGDIISTGDKEIEVIFPDNSIAIIRPNSKVRIRFVDGEMLAESLAIIEGAATLSTQDEINRAQAEEAEKDKKFRDDILNKLNPSPLKDLTPKPTNDIEKGISDGIRKEMNKKTLN